MFYREILPPTIADAVSGRGSAIHMPALAFWKAAPRLGSLPDAAAFEIDALGRVGSHALVLDVEHEPRDFVVRTVGPELHGFLRGDQTGLRLSEDPQKARGSQLWEQLAAVVETGKPAVYETPYNGNFWDFYGIRQLVCPLTRTGMTVDGLFTSLAFLPKKTDG